jgi:hypothetical protein
MINKQTLRSNTSITLNGNIVSKDVIIELSKDWTSDQESRFRKMAQQGGNFSINGISFVITKLNEFKKHKD